MITKAQLIESFETGLPTSYTTQTTYPLSSGTWTGKDSGVIRTIYGVNSGTYSCQLRSQTGAFIQTSILSEGVGTVSLYASSSTNNGGLRIEISNDAINWSQVPSSPYALTTTKTRIIATINDNRPNLYIRFYRTASTVYIDDVYISKFLGAPTGTISGIACAPASLTFNGTPPAGISYYWQTSPTGISTTNNASQPLQVNAEGHYYVRSYEEATGFWGSAVGLPTHRIITAITTQPDDQECTVNASAVIAGPVSNLSYDWEFQQPDASEWKKVTQPDFPNTGLPVSGEGSPNSPSLKMEQMLAPYLNYKFRLVVKNSSAGCTSTSEPAKFTFPAKKIFVAKASGNWNDPNNWSTGDAATGPLENTCSYPHAANCEEVIIPAGKKIVYDVNGITIPLHKLTIDNGGELALGPNAVLAFTNKLMGPDMIINGTFTDKSAAGNGILFETDYGYGEADASWIAGPAATIVKSGNSGTANLMKYYSNGISNIPATATWIYQYNGAQLTFVSSVENNWAVSPVTIPAVYPNLIVENVHSTLTYYSDNGATPKFAMQGNYPITVKGNLNMGGTGIGGVNFKNINTAGPVLVGGDLIIQSNAVLRNTDSTNTGKGFEVKGNLTVNGTLNLGGFTAQQGDLIFSGTSNQAVSGTGSLFLEDVIINNSNGGMVNINRPISIPGTLSFGSPQSRLRLHSANITLLSSLQRTANVGVVPDNNAISYGTGRFVVERYIATGQRWQFIAPNTSGQSLKQSWMEDGNSSITGYGSWIGSPFGTSRNFDGNSLRHAIKFYNGQPPVPTPDDSWTGVSNANDPLYNHLGYMVFIRGDRTSKAPADPAKPTILRNTGTLHIGDLQGPKVLSSSGYQSFGNPYPSAIDFEKLTKSGVANKFFAWNPYLTGAYGVGGYVTIIKIGLNNWAATPLLPEAWKPADTRYADPTTNNHIQSGQAVFFTGPLNASVSFTENAKVNESRTVSRQRKPEPVPMIRLNLLSKDSVLLDGVMQYFKSGTSNSIDDGDAEKISRGADYLSIVSNNRHLSVEGRSTMSEDDTTWLHASLGANGFLLQSEPVLFDSSYRIYLVDPDEGKYHRLSSKDVSVLAIGSKSMPGTSSVIKLYIIYRFESFGFGQLSAIRNNDRSVSINWSVNYPGDVVEYTLLRNTDRGFEILRIDNKTVFIDSALTDRAASYKVQAKLESGEVFTSDVIDVEPVDSRKMILVRNNPIASGEIVVDLMNQPQGDYYAMLLDAGGRQLAKVKTISKGLIREVLKMPINKMPRGIYFLKIIYNNEVKYSGKIMAY